MFEINRNLFVVTIKQPFVDWLNSLPDAYSPPMTVGTAQKDCSIYLVPTSWGEEEAREYIEPFKPAIFASELMDWWRNDEDWPKDLTGLFNEWIDLTYHSRVQDLAMLPIVKMFNNSQEEEDEIEARHSVDAYRERIHEAFFPPSKEADEIAMGHALQALVDFQDVVGDPTGQMDLTLTSVEEGVRFAHGTRHLPTDFYDSLRYLFNDFSRMLKLMPSLSGTGDYRNRLRRLRQQATGVEATFGRWLIDAINGVLKEMILH